MEQELPDGSAATYNAYRPGYPRELFADIGLTCGLNPQSRILEVGMGAGLATAGLLTLGSEIIGIEPGAHLLHHARTYLGANARISYVVGKFEEVRSTQTFDAIAAFTSFHWLDPSKKFSQVESLLRDDGYLILVWNSFFYDYSAGAKDLHLIYRQYMATPFADDTICSEVNKAMLLKSLGREREIYNNDGLCPILLKRYFSDRSYSPTEYTLFLRTFPKVFGLERRIRTRFFNQIRDTLAPHGGIQIKVMSTLLVCRKLRAFCSDF
jgi:SAM-dependent methyltransferase